MCAQNDVARLRRNSMNRKLYLSITVILLVSWLPLCAAAQSDEGSISLGDLARALRKQKEQKATPAAPAVIDNDNLSTVMDDVESKRLKGGIKFSFDSTGKSFKVSTPDVTCSLSFNAQAASLLTDPYVAEDLPESELSKLDGPATIDGNVLQVAVHNGTQWNLKEITVGLTIVRHEEPTTAYFGVARLVSASAGTVVPTEKLWALLLAPIRNGTGPSCKPRGSRLAKKFRRAKESNQSNSQASKILPILNRPLYSSNIFCPSTFQAPIGRIQDFLVLPAFFAGN
jgi:hypothetical protein